MEWIAEKKEEYKKDTQQLQCNMFSTHEGILSAYVHF